MRTCIAKTEMSGEFLSSDFGRCFNDRSERITQLAGVFAVCVVNAPKLISPIWSENWFRIHARN